MGVVRGREAVRNEWLWWKCEKVRDNNHKVGLTLDPKVMREETNGRGEMSVEALAVRVYQVGQAREGWWSSQIPGRC